MDLKENNVTERLKTSTIRLITARATAYAFLLSCCLAPMTFVSACSHDDPVPEHDDPHRPANGEEGNEDPGDQPEETSPIVGIWSNTAGTDVRNFGADGTYHADMPDGEMHDGTYKYDDFKHWLYLSLTTPTQIRMVEYSCRIDGDRMTLYDFDNNETILTRR